MTNTKMHADEVETDESLVRRLLEAQFPDWSKLKIDRVSSFGTDNAIYKLGDGLAVRMPRIESAATQVDKEARWLPAMAPLLPLAVPVPIAKGAAAEGYPWAWSVVPWIAGQDANTARIGDLNQVAIDLARFIAALRLIDTSGGPAPSKQNFFRGVPLRALDRHTRDQLATLGHSIECAAWFRGKHHPRSGNRLIRTTRAPRTAASAASSADPSHLRTRPSTRGRGEPPRAARAPSRAGRRRRA